MTGRSVLLAGASALLLGCEFLGPGPTVCTREARPALAVEIVDAVSGAPVADGATVVARDGAYTDSVTVPAEPEFAALKTSLAYERAGVYTVTVTRTGYDAWEKGGIAVEQDECHVRTVGVLARIRPAS